MATEQKMKFTTKAMAVVMSVLAAYPFYAIVDKLSSPDLDTFVPCNDRPCHFQRLFTGGGLPGTAPDVLAVQNGIARPLMINEEFLAVSVDYQRVEARIVPFSIVGMFGWNKYVWPCVDESCNSHIVEVTQFCLCCVCVDGVDDADDAFGVSLGFTVSTEISYWLKKSNRIDFASRMIHQFRSNHSAPHSALSLQTESRLWSSGFFQLLYHGIAAIVNFGRGIMYRLNVLIQIGQQTSSVSGSEMLIDGLCPDMSQGEMRKLCGSKEMKNLIIAGMSGGMCSWVYTLCIVLWVLVKSAHDLMVLNGCSEERSLLCGLLCIPVQGGAMVSACFLAIGACEVFIARVPDQPCQCYYSMRDLDAILFMATPCMLMGIYLAKVRTIDLSLLAGDVLYYRSFDIPFRFVKRHEAWSVNGLMQPIVCGNKAEEELPEAPSIIPSFRLLACWLTLRKVTGVCVQFSFFTLWGIFVAKLMMSLTKTAVQEMLPRLEWSQSLLMCVPGLCAMWILLNLGYKELCLKKTVPYGLLDLLFVNIPVLLCSLPSLDALCARSSAEVDLLWCSTRWTMGGGILVSKTFSLVWRNFSGGSKIFDSLLVCLLTYIRPQFHDLFLFLGNRNYALDPDKRYLPDDVRNKYTRVADRDCDAGHGLSYARLVLDDSELLGDSENGARRRTWSSLFPPQMVELDCISKP